MKVPGEVIAVARQLGGLRERVVFVGGMVRGLLVSDPAVAGPRPTRDVDVILDVSSPVDFANTTAQLRRLGFREDMSEDAPICRYLLRGATAEGDDLPVDFMPLDPAILGFSNVWYPGAYEAPQRLPSDAGTILVIDAPHFVATKLESFASRGEGDYYHHDLEDVIVLVDGRPELEDELRLSSKDLRAFVVEEVRQLLNDQDFIDALPGYLSPDDASQARLTLVVQRLQAIAALEQVQPAAPPQRRASQGAPRAGDTTAAPRPQVSAVLPRLERAVLSLDQAARDAALTWQPLRSTNIQRFSYEPSSQVLTVKFVKGGVYEYYDVPMEIFTGFKGAASAGRYHHRWIRKRYRYKRVG